MEFIDNTLLIEVTDNRVLGLLKELEKLNLIKVLEENLPDNKPKLSEKYRSKLPVELIDMLKSNTQL